MGKPTADSEYQRALEIFARERDQVLAGECPECGGRIRNTGRDRDQRGPSLVVGDWHHFKCLDCGYFCDVIV